MSSRRPLIAVLTTLAFAAALSAQAGTAFGATTGHGSRAAHEPGTPGRSSRIVVGKPSASAPASGAAAHVPRPTATRPAPGTRVTHLPAPRQQATASGYEPLPNLPVNACQDSTLPRDYGTNFPVPSDPNGFGFANQTVIGWEGNFYAPFAYLSGSYFARGVPQQYTQRGTTYCGAMYSFGAYTYGLAAGQAPDPGSVQWTMADGYLPALTTSFTRNDVAISITDFADRVQVSGNPVELVYTRVTVTNNGSQAAYVPPDGSGPNLVTLTSPPDTVAPGQTVKHDFVAAVDTFSTSTSLPSATQLLAQAPSYNKAAAFMAAYWNQRLSVIPALSLPSVTLPGTGGLADPGQAIDNAYKAAFVYTRIVQVAKSPFSGANNYDWLLNHDLPGILANRFQLGDLTDAQNLLLVGRISEQPNFNEVGANWYWDGLWKTPVAWADYLAMSNQVGFVRTYFHDDATGPSPWGPSLYTMMHTYFLQQLDSSTGYLQPSGDNDSGGTWLFDDEAALAGLAAYRYIATRIGDPAEAQWADSQYTSLLTATNAGLTANEQASGANFLPCEVNQPVTADRCATPGDANWAGSDLWGQNAWDIYLQGGTLSGVLGDPAQTDNLYQMGFSRLAGSVPYPSFGAYTGYSVALNTGYSAAALYGSAYRDLPITSYAWQINTTTGGPNAWWEANGSPPDPNNPWAGSHAAPEFGAIPYAWPMASQTQTLLQSLVARGLVATANPDGSLMYHTALYIGRGVPDAWVVPGEHIAVGNLTSSVNASTGKRATYGVKISFGGSSTGRGSRTVLVSLAGTLPGRDIRVQLPVFADAGVENVIGGSYSAATHTVTVFPQGHQVLVKLGRSARPTVGVQVTSTAPGQHTLPTLTSGVPTTATATVTNTGSTTIRNATVTATVPAGWTSQATSPTSFAAIGPGQAETVTWSVTPPADANGGAGVVVSMAYSAPAQASGSVSAEQWVEVQRPLPLPPGATDLALTAAPSASYTSPWEHVTAINDGVYPTSSNDSQDIRWGCWPETGTQWIELDWTQPITTNGSSVYFLDDGGGVRLPASWMVQYWNGSAWVDVPNPSTYPTADNTFNGVSFDPVTTTGLRVSLQSGAGSVGVIQWVVPSIPGS
jgi:NPCBM-associated, NEW3 domain of alpha-galactosidase